MPPFDSVRPDSATETPAETATMAEMMTSDLPHQEDHHSPTRELTEKETESERSVEPVVPRLDPPKAEGVPRADGKRELTENDCYDKLAYCWPRWKKWMYLASVAAVQVSMNFNTSVFPNAVRPLSTAFHIGPQEARVGQMIYLVTYSIGCELWAPWSEEFGRWPILQLSMFLINIWQIPAALAPNWGTIVVARGLVSSRSPALRGSAVARVDHGMLMELARPRGAFLPPVAVSRWDSLPTSTKPKRSSFPLPSSSSPLPSGQALGV